VSGWGVGIGLPTLSRLRPGDPLLAFPCPLPLFPFLPLPPLPPSFPTPPLHLEVGHLKPTRGLEEALWAPLAGSGAEPQPKSNLMHFSLKIWHLVASILMIFLRINWLNLVFNVTTFDAVIRKLIYALWRRPSCPNSSNFVHNLFTTDIFFQSKLFKRWR